MAGTGVQTELQRPRSDALAMRARRVIPGGVNSNVRLDAPCVFFARAQGAWLWDVDGNDYVDYLLGQGPVFLGHAPEPLLDQVAAAAHDGILCGGQHVLEVEAAERLLGALGWPEMVRFGMTGTEMVQAALRLARAATGRRLFVRFEGHYHGWLDNVLLAPDIDPPRPASAGQLAAALEDSIVLPWNDLDAVRDTLERQGDDICAVLMEPAMLNAGAIAPRPGYLEGVRALCRDIGALLVFDEVITGFRLARGGAAERFGVAPDLAIYGKALAGGWPVAALAGRGEHMERFGTAEVNHSGTFNAYLVGMAAVVSTLELLLNEPPYERIERTGSDLMDGLRRLADERSLPLRLQGFPAAFHASFGDPGEITDYRGLRGRDAAPYRRLANRLVEQGIWVARRGIWYVSAAHGAREVEITLERARAAFATM
jgi:glutamate-1-semialdehyde 2,1-aminomutase